MAMTENAKAIINYLRANDGKDVTSSDVADAIGMARSAVDGAFTSLCKKGYGARVDATVSGTKDISFVAVTDDGMTCDTTGFNDSTLAVLSYIRAHRGEDMTADDIAAGCGITKASVNGVALSLGKKGYCKRVHATVEAPAAVKYLTLTHTGKTCNLDAE